MNRRDLIKGLATVPVLGAFAYGVYKKQKFENYIRGNLRDLTGLNYHSPDTQKWKITADQQQIRLGIIGFGGRGTHLVRSTGHAHPDLLKNWKDANRKNPKDRRYEEYLRQDDLNVRINGVCEVFDPYADNAIVAASNKTKEWDENKINITAKRYKHYKDLLSSPDIDAVIIATPDHWHAEMAIEAAKAGKHIYLEKPMTNTLDETLRLHEAVRDSGVIFQLGHQGRQTESYIKAREAVEKDVIGKISLIEVATNRNDPNGAWVYDIHPEARAENIDWKQWLGNAPSIPFDAKRFHRWRCWWDYATGLTGDLFTHEFDAINQILRMGIPKSVVSSGGIYFFKDGREVPDVLHIVCEYPDRDFSLVYSATLANDKHRGKVIMGHDGNMEISNRLIINPNWRSTKYREQLDEGLISPENPIYAYTPGMREVDAIASATEQYFASRGLLYTYREGMRYDTTFLHIKEWLDCIRNNATPSCDIDQGFEEAVVAHMGTIAYRKGVKTYWDDEKKKIVG